MGAHIKLSSLVVLKNISDIQICRSVLGCTEADLSNFLVLFRDPTNVCFDQLLTILLLLPDTTNCKPTYTCRRNNSFYESGRLQRPPANQRYTSPSSHWTLPVSSDSNSRPASQIQKRPISFGSKKEVKDQKTVAN